ncbi:MAG: pyruvate dehydrogenase complex dihydrolipoamide acetyltransferase [Lewinellaceae bacterium]|nr:pyruvate dehydrogenase complex dihydrolipoamide acetyltransferase [Saprospiraceae bacterium]MCB9312125.1 pyruvate dehydrogenase complex dihydrolipoamide acetyltransferase [Lewinellaceae bacterium]HRW75741.1 pyruvate dehydrogenase complex dihydrolipoamide acetyltransferase [Saprospiraceae bacterium]
MAEIIRMPRMSDTMEEGNIVAWLKKVGDKVEAGDVLAEVETDKATMELETYQEGTLLYIGVEQGTIPVNGLLAIIGKEGEDYQALLREADGKGNGSAPKAESPAAEAASSGSSAASTPSPAPTAPVVDDGQRVKASPLARAMAEEAGVDLRQIPGSGGDGGRVVKRDVEAYLQGKPAAAATAAAAPVVTMPEGGFTDVPVTQMRKTIARRLGESKFSAPHFYLTIEIDMDQAMIDRQRINEMAPTKISFNDLVIKAATRALRLHPQINSSWLGDRIRTNHDINIGVAVAVDEGLLVPVIRHADMKSLSQINSEVAAFAEKAKARKLQPEEMQGNTFTISNLGMFGIEEFTAIINPPDACILAVGGIIQKPVVKDGQMVIGNRMKVTLSCDHRVVDGAMGAKFLQTFSQILSAPIRMLI